MGKLLIIKSILEHDWVRLENVAFVVAIIYGCVLISILLDFIMGIAKARERGEKITCPGIRKTFVTKIRDYYIVLILATLADSVISLWYSLPLVTAVVTLGLIFTEAKSIYEKMKSDGSSIEQLPGNLEFLLKNKDDLMKVLKQLDDTKKVNLDYKPEEKEESKSEEKEGDSRKNQQSKRN